jgi:hypothetical protein
LCETACRAQPSQVARAAASWSNFRNGDRFMPQAFIASTPRRLDSIAAGPLRRLHEAWQARRAGAVLPRMREFLPDIVRGGFADFALIVPDLAGGRNLRVRLAAGRLGLVGDLREGAVIEALQPPALRDHLLLELRAVFFAMRPSYHIVHSRVAGIAALHERLILPIACRGTEPEALLLAAKPVADIAELMVARPHPGTPRTQARRPAPAFGYSAAS